MALLAAHGALLFLGDLSRHLPLALLLVGFAGAALWLAVRSAGEALAPAAILGVAALLRLTLLPLPPSLSGDILRYIWDGRVAAAGHNPYGLAPAAPELESLRDPLWERMPHRGVATVYPPLAMTFFALASRLPAPVPALKTLLAAVDLFGCWLLLRLAQAHGVPQSRVLWYAWNPLVTLEVAGMGHVDVLGVVACLFVAVSLTARPARPAAAGIAGAAAVLAKLVPLAAIPMWARQSGRPRTFLIVALGLVAVAAAPVALTTGGMPSGLLAYAMSWEWNGPLFEPLSRILAALRVDDLLHGLLDRLKAGFGHDAGWNRLYPYVYPQLLAKLLLAGGALSAIFLSLRDRDAIGGAGRLFGRLLLCAATVYPWYVLWVLPWAALQEDPAWLALSGLILLSYLGGPGSWPLFPWLYLAIWLPFFALLLVRRRWSTR